jgi:hypothetical protein
MERFSAHCNFPRFKQVHSDSLEIWNTQWSDDTERVENNRFTVGRGFTFTQI